MSMKSKHKRDQRKRRRCKGGGWVKASPKSKQWRTAAEWAQWGIDAGMHILVVQDQLQHSTVITLSDEGAAALRRFLVDAAEMPEGEAERVAEFARFRAGQKRITASWDIGCVAVEPFLDALIDDCGLPGGGAALLAVDDLPTFTDTTGFIEANQLTIN